MTNLKILSAVAIMALVLPTVVPSESFAAPPGKGGPGAGRGGGMMRSGGAPAARFNGGGAPGPRFSGGGTPGPRFSGGGSPGPRFAGNPGGGGGNWQNNGGRNWNGGGNWHRGGRGYIPGAVAGAVVGGALASSYGYYDPGYDSGYYGGDQYYDDSAVVAVAPGPADGDDSVAYCMQTYRSYDPSSGTYMGYDGLRHPCP